ncbi:MAG: hypothetical protein ACOYXT_20640 [Bacteroidota bacterium]
MKYLPIFLVMLVAHLPVTAQKQLVVLRRENVLLRLRPGDEFVFKLKKSKNIRRTYVNNLLEDAIVTHRDTVPFHRIDRVYFRQHKFYNNLGSALVIGGAGLFLVDQFNTIIVRGDGASLDGYVSRLSASSLAAGLPLMLIKKKSQRIRYPYRLLIVGKESKFYVPDPRGMALPDGR